MSRHASLSSNGLSVPFRVFLERQTTLFVRFSVVKRLPVAQTSSGKVPRKGQKTLLKAFLQLPADATLSPRKLEESCWPGLSPSQTFNVKSFTDVFID